MASAVWARWSQSNIVENEFFAQNKDWVGFNTMLNGNITRNFAVTIEFAKHIAMMAKTKRAHDYRNYFIECEKLAMPKSDERKTVISKLEKQRDAVISRFVGMN